MFFNFIVVVFIVVFFIANISIIDHHLSCYSMFILSLKLTIQKKLYDLFFVYLINHDINDFFQWYIFYRTIVEQRYMISRFFVFKSNMKSNIFFIFVEDRFRIFARMIKFNFRHIINLIKNDNVFQNQIYISQIIVETQLLFALYKLRHFDNVNAFRHVSMLWNVFENHVFNCTKKIIKTLYKLRNEYVC